MASDDKGAGGTAGRLAAASVESAATVQSPADALPLEWKVRFGCEQNVPGRRIGYSSLWPLR
jgi:hypothetical protein